MIRIAVCDDDRGELGLILGLLEDFRREYPQYPFTSEAFGEPFTLLGEAERRGGFDLYLLDVIMPGMTGMESARELRGRGDGGEIVFLTTSREYGAEAFEVDALNYLVKPVNREALNRCLIEAWQKLSGRRPPLAVRLVGGELRKVRTNEIAYIESFNYYREIILVNGKRLKTHTTLQEWRERLSECPEFYLPNKSYIVNLEQVESISGGGMTVAGCRIGLARDRKKTAASYYLDYLMNKK